MKPELEEKLFNDFPLLFNPKADIRDSLMAFGFECGDGWYQLIRELSEKLYPLIQKYTVSEDDFHPTVLQVKEKYGTLRFYLSFGTQEMEELIDEYEEKSGNTCEVCGKPGSIDYKVFWLEAKCDEHRR